MKLVQRAAPPCNRYVRHKKREITIRGAHLGKSGKNRQSVGRGRGPAWKSDDKPSAHPPPTRAFPIDVARTATRDRNPGKLPENSQKTTPPPATRQPSRRRGRVCLSRAPIIAKKCSRTGRAMHRSRWSSSRIRVPVCMCVSMGFGRYGVVCVCSFRRIFPEGFSSALSFSGNDARRLIEVARASPPVRLGSNSIMVVLWCAFDRFFF